MESVIFICGAGYVSGKEIIALEVGSELHRQGYTARFITSHWHDGDFQRRLRDAGIDFDVLPIGFISGTLSRACLGMTAEQVWRWPGLLIGYRKVLDKGMPRQIVHTNWHHLLLLSPFLQPKRDIFWLHEVIPNRPQYGCLLRALTHRLKCFITVSEAVGLSLRRLGVSAAKIRTIHNGIRDPAPGMDNAHQERRRLCLGIVGQVGAWKGHDDLLIAFGTLARSHPTVDLHIYGRGAEEYQNKVKARAADLGIADRVVWHGFVSDRAAIFSNIDICVVPSRSEDPLPTSAIEAAFFGLPVVATRKGGLPEIVEEGVTGFLVEADNPRQLGNRISLLAANKQLRTRFGQNAREQALKRFNRERFIEEFAFVLRS